MYIIVGLGNPGREYEKTRHNIGFMTLDILAERYDIEIKRNRFQAYFGEGHIGAEKVLLVKPDTYMNNSGIAVREVFNWYKIEHHQLILIYDDADLQEGYIRIRECGSSGTHNGMRSVIYQLGFDDFPRVRVGIGKAEHNMIQHVLTMPQGEDMELLQKAMRDAADAAEMIVKGQLKEAQKDFNRKPPKKKEPAEDKTETETEEENKQE